MSEAVWIAIIGALGVIVAASITAYFNQRANNKPGQSSDEKSVCIDLPKDGEDLIITTKEVKPIHRPISGKVFGFSTEELETLGLEVILDIETDRWYSQGAARVQANGRWKLEDASFGGTVHRVRAAVRDNYREYASTEIKVTVPT